jgi:uncharacterized protein YndB with AHSA1/START domain
MFTIVVSVLVVLAVLAVLAGVLALVGARLPPAHTATRSVRLRGAPQAVWALITDVDGYPQWRPGLKKVERLPDADGRPRWREGDTTFELVEAAAPTRLVTRIADPDLPYGGTWTHVVEPGDGGGSVLTITENGEVFNPLFRFVSRYVIGDSATIEKYLKAVAARFGETVPTGDA